MKNMRWTILAALVLAAPSVVQAQDVAARRGGGSAGAAAAAAGAPGAPGATGSTSDTGAINNADSSSTTSMTSGTSTTSPGMSTSTGASGGSMTGGAMSGDATMMADGSSKMPDTGGEPLLVSLVGMTLFAGAFALRRRVLS